jgi:hypothetical protein
MSLPPTSQRCERDLHIPERLPERTKKVLEDLRDLIRQADELLRQGDE